MATYFTSDLHIGHRLVAGIRGFRIVDPEVPESNIVDVEAHDWAVARAWSVVRDEDIIWVLGDLCVSMKTWPRALDLLSSLPGRKRLVCGNHDPVSSIHREAWRYQKEALRVFESVHDYAKIRMGQKTVLLSHYPYSGVGSEGLRGPEQIQAEERYTEFRLTDCGTPLVHGHTHGDEKLHFSGSGTPQVHVGLDAWGMKLVPQTEVWRLLDTAVAPVTVES